MHFLAVIGQKFRDAGLEDILIESSLVGPSAVTAVLRGKHYNRALRCHKVIFEALFHLLWPVFEEWLEEEPHGLTITDADTTALLGDLEKARDSLWIHSRS